MRTDGQIDMAKQVCAVFELPVASTLKIYKIISVEINYIIVLYRIYLCMINGFEKFYVSSTRAL
jgi:hypothetical protein